MKRSTPSIPSWDSLRTFLRNVRANRVLRAWAYCITVIIMVLLGSGTARANQNAQGWCEDGNQSVVTSGLVSTTLIQRSFPQCTVTVYVHGGGLATIYSDNSSTPLANPFTATTNGQWLFYAADGRYDITMSGAGFPSPVTYSDVILFDCTGGVCSGGAGNPASPGYCAQFANQLVTAFATASQSGVCVGVDSTSAPTVLTVPLNENITGSEAVTGNACVGGPIPSIGVTCPVYNASGSQQTTTGTIAASNTSLTVASAIDFEVNETLSVYGAGPTSTLAAPTGTSGSQVLKVASIVNYNTNGLGATHGISCTGTTATLTTWGFYGFPNGSTATISGSSVSGFNGSITIASEPNAYTLTFTVGSCPAATAEGGTLTLAAGSGTYKYQIVAEDTLSGYSPASSTITVSSAQPLSAQVDNALSWTRETGATQYLVYSDRGLGGALVCEGVALQPGSGNPSWQDYGFTNLSCPDNRPMNPPGSATAGILFAKITAIVGNTITLGSAATNAVSGAIVQHDDTNAIAAAYAAAVAAVQSGTAQAAKVLVPFGSYRIEQLTIGGDSDRVTLEFDGYVIPRLPVLITGAYKTIVGSSSFSCSGVNPLFDITGPNGSMQGITSPYCPGDGVYAYNVTNWTFSSISISTQSLAPGHAFDIEQGSGGSPFGFNFNFTSASSLGNSIVPSMYFGDVTSSVHMSGPTINGSGIEIHCDNGVSECHGFTIDATSSSDLSEGINTPILTLDGSGGGLANVALIGASPADPTTGQDTALVNIVSGITVKDLFVSGQPTPIGIEGSLSSAFNVREICGVETGSCAGQGYPGAAQPTTFPNGYFIDNLGTLYQTGILDASAAAEFRPKSGTVANLPATCSASPMDIYLATNTTAGQNWYFCTATNTWTQAGLGVRAITGSASTDTILYSDNLSIVEHDIAGSAAVTETLHTPTDLNNPNFAFSYANHSGNIDTMQPCTSGTGCSATFQIIKNQSTAAANIIVRPGENCRFTVDPHNASTWDADCIPFKFRGTITNGTSAISSGTCATPVTLTVAGTQQTDVATVTPQTSPIAVTGFVPGASLYWVAYPPSSGTTWNFYLCNGTGSSLTPGTALTWNVVVQ